MLGEGKQKPRKLGGWVNRNEFCWGGVG